MQIKKILLTLILLFIVNIETTQAAVPPISEAQRKISTSDNDSFSMFMPTLDYNGSPSGFEWGVYRDAVYPDPATGFSGLLTSSPVANNFSDYEDYWSYAGCTNNVTVMTCDTSTFASTTGLTNGDYFWWRLYWNGVNVYWSQFQYLDGKVEVELPLTGQTRIVSISPETGGIASTTTTFSTTYESASPTPNKVCIVWQRQNYLASYSPEEHCESAVSSGLDTIATTTTLALNDSYLYKTQIYTTSTTTPSITSEIRYLTVGAYQWSPLFDDVASTTVLDPTTFCDSFLPEEPDFFNYTYGVCKVAMYILAVPTAIITPLFSTMVTTITNTPPVSWYFQIKEQLESIQYTTETMQSGFIMQAPFNIPIQFMSQEQLVTWTGGYLGALRTLTTISLIILYLVYLINRVLYRIF